MNKRAFTLLELLVVTAIIGVLAAIAVPVIAGVQSRAKQTACASNLRQLGMAITAYAGENDGAFPESAHTDEKKSWVYTLAPYLGNVDEVRICPADPKAEARRRAETTSYVINEYMAVAKTGPFVKTVESYNNLRRLALPSRTITVFIGSDRMDEGITNDHTHSRNWRGWEQVLDDIQPDRHRNGSPNGDRTKGVANYLYADGHVEAIEAAKFKQFIDAGINLAKPPETPGEHQLP
jgi:prepilin-type N-terminal cleavage/methylation domain-containing protein/prepilin-type processing-associated H-X9-DG protein